MTGNISDSIVIERNNIILDGSGYTLQGTMIQDSRGIDISGRTLVAIQNLEITTFHYGVWLDYSSNNNRISGNDIKSNLYGVWLNRSEHNTISGNSITGNGFGILLNCSDHNTISDNIMTNVGFGVWLDNSSNITVLGNALTDDGLFVQDSYGNVVEGNVVNGKPLVYLEGVSDPTIAYAGQVVLVDCDGILVEGLDLSGHRCRCAVVEDEKHKNIEQQHSKQLARRLARRFCQ